MPDRSICSIDDLRAAHPELGVGLYALEPGGPVTLEIYTPDGTVYTFTGTTAAAAFASAFPAPETAADLFE
jgi:hypothetical protein